MDVLLTEEEEMLKNGAREFLNGECPPDLVREMETDDLGYPADLWKKIVDLGWPGLAFPEKYGGLGLPLSYLGLVFQELGRALAPVPLHSTIVAALAINSDGSEEQRQDILPKVSSGELIMTWALTERDPRYFIPGAINMEAVADGDGYVISGTKLFVENFGAAKECLLVCRTAQASSSNEGISLFLVGTSSPGISHIPLITMAKDKQSQVVFDKVRVPKQALVGNLHEGWPAVERMLDKATVLLCAQHLGAARHQTEMAIEYAKNRVAFGRPIGAFQAIAHTCADMITWVDGGDLLTFEALWRMDQGLPASIEVSQAKAFCNEKLMVLGRLANAIHGGIAFIEEVNLTLWFRRVEAMAMKLGTSREHRARIAEAILDQPGQVELGKDMYQLATSQ